MKHSTDADLDALLDVCRRLGGFEPRVSFEWLDGALTALVAGPRLPPFDEWCPALLGDAFERVFGDPPSAAEARRAIDARLGVIVDQLYSEALADEPDRLRLEPQLLDYGPEQDTGDLPLPGEEWARGFVDAVIAFDPDWRLPAPAGEQDSPVEEMLRDVTALILDAPALEAYLAETYPGETPTRDDLIDVALFAVQDLRVFWSTLQRPPPPRRVEKPPGRNDPCPCGSGKKFKKCHGS